MPKGKTLGWGGYGAADTDSTLIALEAAEWLVAMDDDLEHFDRQKFLAWLKSSPQHVREFLLLTAIAHQVKSLNAR